PGIPRRARFSHGALEISVPVAPIQRPPSQKRRWNMGRKTEPDYPGAWWHVTNRGICKRTVFESSTDTSLLDECL
ncbi:MAG: hypothetical protein MUC98_08155, partial [Desulfobacterota bacterium]|nr:hypothetical protein [Thermodesulfobacteriota bacterium]